MIVSTYLRALAVLMAFACVSSCEAKPPLNRLHDASFRLENGLVLCTATAVGPHVVLAATHCMHEGTQRIALNGEATDVVSVTKGGPDHVFVRTTLTFKVWLRQGKALEQGDPVQFFGNPDGIFDVMRRGYFAGIAQAQTPDWPQAMEVGALMFVTESTHGDSGSAILDAHGDIVGVVSGGYVAADGFRLMWSLPLSFTAEQWKAAQE